jgi:hypothetical protein
MPAWKLSELSQPLRQRILAAMAARGGHSQPEPHQGAPLGNGGQDPPVLVNLAGPVRVRITRVGGRTLDGDNLQGGCKQLRDAIAAALGRRGDSDVDGLAWEYCQRPAAPEEAGTLIELFDNQKGV